MVKLGLLLAVVGLGVGCGDGRSDVGPDGVLVGGPCTVEAQCASSCIENSHYPGGMCSVKCDSDANCPLGTSCVGDAGGICAVNCLVPADCVAFGRGFTCSAEGRKGGSGDTFVCRVD